LCGAVIIVRSEVMDYIWASEYFSVQRGTAERYVKDTTLSPHEPVNVHVGPKNFSN
jgi:hypothetical protein